MSHTAGSYSSLIYRLVNIGISRSFGFYSACGSRKSVYVGMCVIILHATHLILRPPGWLQIEVWNGYFWTENNAFGRKEKFMSIKQLFLKNILFGLKKYRFLFWIETNEKKNYIHITLNLLNTKNKSWITKKKTNWNKIHLPN